VPKGLGRTTVKSVMGKYEAGNLKSGSGGKVTNPKQAVAIAIHEGYPHGYPTHNASTDNKHKKRSSGY